MGYAGLYMTNLFAFRATDPKKMKVAADPVGPENDAHLLALAKDAAVIVAAWGANGTHRGRDSEVRTLLPALRCLALTKDGHPGHPLYLRKTLTPVPMGSNVQVEGAEGCLQPQAPSQRRVRRIRWTDYGRSDRAARSATGLRL